MHNYRLYWKNGEATDRFDCQAESTKDALTIAIQSDIPSLEWLEIWEDLGDRWRIEDLKSSTFSQRFALKHVATGKQYINKKTGNVYQLLFLGLHSETMENLTVYLPVHPCWRSKTARLLLRWAAKLLKEERVWARPLGLFEEKFDRLD